MPDHNIVLTGFMGTGKTSVGKRVAERLGRPFLDMDDVLVARAGKSVSAIFAEEGEPAFRAMESELCRELGEQSGQVIATGGGAVLDPANRTALSDGGRLICLDASRDAITARLAGGNGRPLLSGSNKANRIADLMAERAAAYAAIPLHLDTSSLTVAEAAERVMGLAIDLPAGGHRIPVRLGDGQHYDVLVADGLLAQAGRRIAEAGIAPCACAVVSNPTVAPHHAAALLESLVEAGYAPQLYEVPDGEGAKTLEQAGRLYEQFATDGRARNEPVIALGGGVTGDLAGFVAATWLRGVPLVQVPTSLLAMVDSSVGGKVAVDTPAGKNLVGAFKQPDVVLIDPGLLSTLPGAEFRAGLAEVIKTAIIGDPVLFEQLSGDGPASLVSMVSSAVRVKGEIVEQDPTEKNQRAWLNLGHTFAHALELVSGFALPHGPAVALGVIAACRLSADLGHCPRDLPVRVENVTERVGLATCWQFDPTEALTAMATDKKRVGKRLRFVLPQRIGRVAVFDDVPVGAVLVALESLSAEG